jgi:hypothetical protein
VNLNLTDVGVSVLFCVLAMVETLKAELDKAHRQNQALRTQLAAMEALATTKPVAPDASGEPPATSSSPVPSSTPASAPAPAEQASADTVASGRRASGDVQPQQTEAGPPAPPSANQLQTPSPSWTIASSAEKQMPLPLWPPR